MNTKKKYSSQPSNKGMQTDQIGRYTPILTADARR